MGRKTRRGLLFAVTMVTILLALTGALFLGDFLEGNPLMFVIFWSVCFICAMVVIGMAFVDMRGIRREHRRRQEELDADLARIVSDAKALAESNQESQ